MLDENEEKVNEQDADAFSYEDYKVGMETSTGGIIERIIEKNDLGIIYINQDKQLGYEYDDDSVKVNIRKVHAKFDLLYYKIKDDLSEETQKKLTHELGSMFFYALNSENDKEALSYFKDIGYKIKNIKTEKESKLIFIIYFILFVRYKVIMESV